MKHAFASAVVLSLGAAACSGSEVALQPDPEAVPHYCPFSLEAGEDVCDEPWPFAPELATSAVSAYAALTSLLARNERARENLERTCSQLASALGATTQVGGPPSLERTRAVCALASSAIADIERETSLRLVRETPSCRPITTSMPACVRPLRASPVLYACAGSLDASDGRDLSRLTPHVTALLALRADVEDALGMLSIVNRDFTNLTALPACTQLALARATRGASDLAALLSISNALLRFDGT